MPGIVTARPCRSVGWRQAGEAGRRGGERCGAGRAGPGGSDCSEGVMGLRSGSAFVDKWMSKLNLSRQAMKLKVPPCGRERVPAWLGNGAGGRGCNGKVTGFGRSGDAEFGFCDGRGGARY